VEALVSMTRRAMPDLSFERFAGGLKTAAEQ
jgi:hypothetical protein